MKKRKIQYTKKKSFALRGAIVGAAIGILILLISIWSAPSITESEILSGLFKILTYPLVSLISLIIDNWCHNNIGCLILIIPLYFSFPLFYGLIGLLIGLIMDLIRSKIKI